MSTSRQQSRDHSPVMEDCSDTEEEYYYNNNNNNNVGGSNNNNSEYEDKNNNSQRQSRQQSSAQQIPAYHKLTSDRPLNITVTAKVLFGSVSAISALNAERKKKPS